MAHATALATPLSGSGPPPASPPAHLQLAAPAGQGPGARLQVAPYAAADALALERELGIGHVLAQILVRRGLADPATARRFIDAREAHDPSAFDGIERALDLIRGHIAAGRPIVVHGDYDVDGVCATAIMIRALRSLGAAVSWFLPSRAEDGYGLAAATVQRLAQRGTALILTVDCGITAVEEVAAARAAGMDVVVCDHHAPRADGVLPDCPIVHPALCSYPCPTLCGAAVAYKLAGALGAVTAEDDLDLVALATVADLVPLVGENRRLVRQGLSALGATAKPGLRALMAVSRADPSALDTGTLGFRLAPRINAAGRLRRADAGLELVLTEDSDRAKAIALELDALNAERRAVEQRITWEAESQVAELGPRLGYVLWSEDWHPGVVGIVASRIVERHHRPAVLVALDGDTGGGSGRSIPGFDLLGALDAGASHLRRYGGHRAAAGLTIDAGQLDAFRAAFEAHAEAVLTPELLEPVERVDAVVSGHELGLGLAEELEALEPCGMGNPSPRLLVPGGRFDDVRSMGEGRHARFSVISGGVRARAVAFGCDGHVTDDPARPLDATFRLERNAWNGAVEPRLVLRHSQPCAPTAIERLPGGSTPYLEAALAEVDAVLEPMPSPAGGAGAGAGCAGAGAAGASAAGAGAPGAGERRTVLDRRGHSPLAVLVDAVAGGDGRGQVLALCADVSRRLPGLRERVGGFTLAAYAELEADPAAALGFVHIVALDPPTGAAGDRVLRAGGGIVSLAWGEPELRFAATMLEREYALRASLADLYRALRPRGRAAGAELDALLRGEGAHGRSPRLAGRLVRVLSELELVDLVRDPPALTILDHAPTALDRSPAFRFYSQVYEEGQRYLNRANLRAGA
ncbi:MAG TPA: single-stranded-DNA-specific exonuclease RecJ [Solirubrobacteraceae bacterium]|nr:single-stranded-DNA-specific exonuclease RecJ [Solirubrobacteraceae bacterium]